MAAGGRWPLRASESSAAGLGGPRPDLRRSPGPDTRAPRGSSPPPPRRRPRPPDFSTPGSGCGGSDVRSRRARSAATCPGATVPERPGDSAARLSRNGLGGTSKAGGSRRAPRPEGRRGAPPPGPEAAQPRGSRAASPGPPRGPCPPLPTPGGGRARRAPLLSISFIEKKKNEPEGLERERTFPFPAKSQILQAPGILPPGKVVPPQSPAPSDLWRTGPRGTAGDPNCWRCVCVAGGGTPGGVGTWGGGLPAGLEPIRLVPLGQILGTRVSPGGRLQL